MADWVWIDSRIASAIHDEQLAVHGGGQGLRDEKLLESALARARNVAAYGEPDAAELAASYGFGIARNHPFVDGNKRTAAVVCETFLNVNGFWLEATNPEFAALFEFVAAGQVTEEELADWLRERISPTP